jgi:hypothetical protein
MHAEARARLGTIATWRKRFDVAAAHYGQALALDSNHAEARLGLSQALLASGDFDNGWREFERARPHGIFNPREMKPRVWQGAPLQGTLLIFAEGGFGDIIQFARLATRVRSRVGRIVWFLQPYCASLARLLRTIDGVDEVATSTDCFGGAEAMVSVLSLPYLCHASLAARPGPVPYVRADAEARARWTGRLDQAGWPRVGVAWAGSPGLAQARSGAIDRRRSIPLPALAPLFDIRDVTFVSLQKGAAADTLGDSPLRARLVDPSAEIDDFSDTAALAEELDLIITVDTSVVHLAGALARPVWLMNRFDSCWRWGPSRDDAPWYPTLRIFRQDAFGDWGPVIDRVAAELQRWRSHLQRPAAD